jgi:sugar lactone lactonase YvrE
VRTFVADPVSDVTVTHGEGPRWDAVRDELAYVDLEAGVVHRAKFREGYLEEVGSFHADRPVGAANPIAGSPRSWLLAAGTAFARADEQPDGSVSIRYVPGPDAGREDEVRMNEAVCDPAGRLVVGTMAYDERRGAGHVIVLDLDGSVRELIATATIANGTAWSADGATMFWADSGAGTVTAFAYDLGRGTVAGARTIVERRRDEGVADGIAIDDEGCLWLALYGGRAVHRVSPDGEHLASVEVPADHVTAVAFAGTTLLITTSRRGLDASTIAGQPNAGRVCAVDVAVSGPPAAPFRGTLPH